MTRYPNLLELIEYHPYGEPTICDHAEIEPELLKAILENNEPFMPMEIMRLSRLYVCPASVLSCPKRIMLDMNRWRHKVMSAEVDALYMRLKYMAKCEKNEEAVKYLGFCEWEMQRYMRAACNNQLSYGHWFGMRKQISQYIAFATPQPKRRALQPRKQTQKRNEGCN